jgi:hypothetical protein
LHLDNSRSPGSDSAINPPKNGNGAKATNPQ